MAKTTSAISASSPYFDLGSFSRKVATTSPDAQIWFNRGLTWAYAFNHDEAITCFEQVLAHDSGCIMGYWGIAYCSGPHYNRMWSAFNEHDLSVAYERGVEALTKADTIIASASPVEKVLTLAIRSRYPATPEKSALTASNAAYASAMRAVYKQYGEHDLDVQILTADALMNMAPWHLFESRTGLPNKSTPVLEIGDILHKAMQHPDANSHPGFLHLYIHYMEMSRTPEAALIPSDRLRDLVPDSGHLQHMPSHIYVFIGDYRQAIDSNIKGIAADDKYWNVHPDTLFYTVYRLHNIHSLIYAAMMAGQSKVALEACDRLEAATPQHLLELKSPPMADWAEVYHSVRMHVLIRFGMWSTIKNLTLPEDQELYCCTTAFIHYAKGIAWAATSDIASAEAEQKFFQQTKKLVPRTRIDFPNLVVDELEIAEAMLAGEIAYRKGLFDEAFTHLRHAIKRDDSLTFSEPWGWQVPTRHAYAALLLEQGHVQDAAKVYAQDLGLDDSIASAHQHPNNIWSLQGYYDCLIRLDRGPEARIIKQQLTLATAIADVPVKTSCFCSRSASKATTNGASSLVTNGLSQ